MILLQNPNIPTSVNPVEIDSAIIDIKTELEVLPWLTNGYGRAFKNLDITNGERVYFPEVYLGKQNGSYRYTNISPDNDKQGQCFFYVRRETISEYQTGMYSFLNYDVAVIFSVNMELINATLTETDVFQQVLVAQVRDVLTRQILGKSYVLKVNTVEFLFEDVFREFNLTEQSTMEKSPLSHFRFNISVKMPETCPVPSIVPPVLNFNSFLLQGVNEYILPQTGFLSTYDRTDAMSLSFWVKPVAFGSIDIIFHKYDPFTETGILFYWDNSQVLHLDYLQGTVTNSFRIQGGLSITMLSGVWQHIGFTFDGTDANGMNIYYNGVQKSRVVVTNTLSTSIINSANVEIGGISSINIYNNVIVNVCRLWNVELSQAEMTTEYNSGIPLSVGVQSGSLIMDMKGSTGSTWNGSDFDIPDSTGVTTGYQSVNLDEVDAIADYPT